VEFSAWPSRHSLFLVRVLIFPMISVKRRSLCGDVPKRTDGRERNAF
jgi:hypothetical protein